MNDCCASGITLCEGGTLCAIWSCVSKTANSGKGCPTTATVNFECHDACDCTGGKICCGTETGLSAKTVCTDPVGGWCPGADAGTGAQFCEQSAECANGQPCTSQTCTGNAQAMLCDSNPIPAPFSCTPN
jgi:hypothetical protein